MTQRKRHKAALKRLRRRKVEADFNGGRLTSDAGLLLLREVDRKLGLIDQIDEAIPDPRDPRYTHHSQREMLAARIYAIAAGYEDDNDHQTLRHDPALQVAADKDPEEDAALASPPTLCRLGNRPDRKTLVKLHEVLVDQFLDAHEEPPEEIILDFDATDDPIHGEQEGRYFNGFYRGYCYLPLYVFCGEHLLVAYLRSSSVGAAKHARAITKLLVQKIRQRWPDTRIILRGDSGFCRWRLMRWCDSHNVGYIFGLQQNTTLKRHAEPQIKQAAADHEKHGGKHRHFTWFRYRARRWDRTRWVLAKAEHNTKGANPRFVVTNLIEHDDQVNQLCSPATSPRLFYEDRYCLRGEMENRIKEQQMCLFADRTSCGRFLANQFRLLLSGFAYVLTHGLRRLGLAGTEAAKWRVDTIRLKLIKIAARVCVSARRVVFHLASSCPYESQFRALMTRLTASDSSVLDKNSPLADGG